jgi:hypothetical protein
MEAMPMATLAYALAAFTRNLHLTQVSAIRPQALRVVLCN